MGKPVARAGDMHVCPKVNPGPVPHVGGPITAGSPDVFVNGMPIARAKDSAICVGPGASDKISAGSGGVFVNGLAIARQGDPCGHGGKIVAGSGNVFAGEAGSAPVHPKPVIRKGKHSGGGGNSTSPVTAPSVASKAEVPSSLPTTITNKKIAPASLTEAATVLEARRAQIVKEGYQPKYSDAELQEIAKSGNIGEDRFQARFMETNYLTNRDTPGEHLSGAMGREIEGLPENGAKYWSTSFDQIEDADTDPKLIAEKLGLTYNPKANYSLVIVDSHLAAPMTGVKSVSATFENVSEFANTELSDDFPKEFTDQVMNPEFQTKYSELYKAADEAEIFKGNNNWNSSRFANYLKSEGYGDQEVKVMKQRFEMHRIIGNNEDYLGNGLTKNNNPTIDQEYGVVETLNFERNKINLAQLDDVNAIKILPGLKTI